MGEDDPQLVDIRRRGQDAGTAEDWETLLALEAELRTDEAWWPIVWAPACAMAAGGLGRRAQARSFLEEAIAGGFSQPELYDPTFTEALSGDPEWPRLTAAMRANVPPPPVTLLDWPDLTPSAPLSLDRLPAEREELLRAQLPRIDGGGWDAAVALLAWVADRWKHANDHVASRDAVTILERVDAGERFACVEYTAVLSQALNAVGIPARAVAVLQENYHTGVGKAHQVSEAWIDELATWVVLDGQNGLYWVDEDSVPLGVPALQDRCRAGGPAPGYVCVGSKELPERQAPLWFSHFRHANTTGAAWETQLYPAVFQTDFVAACDLLLRDRDQAYPDLSQVGVGVVSHDGRPGLRLHTPHPYATGFAVTDGGRTTTLGLAESWPLPAHPAGEHRASVATLTPYATMRSHPVTYHLAPNPR
jgi:hypothetical protein